MLNEDAVSKAQTKLFRVAKAVKNRELNPHDASQRAVDIARTVQSHKIDNYANTDDTHLPERVPPKLKEYDQGPYPANGGNTMGSLGDASFIGTDGKMKGAAKKPVYKTPKSSIHYKKGRFPNEPDFYDEDNWETEKSRPSPNIAGKTAYVADKSVPKNSIHYEEKPDEDRKNSQTMEQLGMPVAADGTIDGGPREMDPIAGKKTKKKEFADASKYGYPRESVNEESKWWDKSFEELDKLTTNRLLNILKKARIAVLYRQSHTDEYSKDEIEDIVKYYNNIKLILSDRGHVQRKSDNIKTEIKDYNDQVVPKSSIHYGERDKVKGEPKMKFEKIVKAGFVPDELKNLKTQGDWKNNLTKAVMDLTDEANSQEKTLPVPIVPMSNTPEFPFAKEDGSMVYPIPGIGVATKSGDNWTFGDTPPLPASQESGEGCSLGHGEPSANMIDIPCSKRPLIKKLMMFIKKEQSNLHEGIELKGEYNGKIVKLNTIYEGVERRFKTYVKNEGKILEIHFGPKKNEACK